jgi:hypothetical protein
MFGYEARRNHSGVLGPIELAIDLSHLVNLGPCPGDKILAFRSDDPFSERSGDPKARIAIERFPPFR